MEANMSLQHPLKHGEEVDQVIQNNNNGRLENGTDADRNDIANVGTGGQSDHQAESHQELEESELVNFEQNLDETAMNHGSTQEAGEYGHGNEGLEGNVDELNGQSDHGSHNVGQDFLTSPARPTAVKEIRDRSHEAIPLSDSGQLHLNLPYDASRPVSRPPSSSRNLEANLTTSLSHVSHAYSHSPMSDVNLQNMTSAEYQAIESGPSQQFTQYSEASQLPTRRQNVACDACRARKVKCVRKPMAEQCEHCRSKGTPCTSIYVTQVNSSRKGRTGKEPSFGNNNNIIPVAVPVINLGAANGSGSVTGLSMANMNGSALSPHGAPILDLGHQSESDIPRAIKRARIGGSEKNGEASSMAPEFDLSNLLLYMFSPTLVTHNYFGYTDRPCRSREVCWPYAPTADGPPSKAHFQLMTESMRIDLATDLVETYFQICHIRAPLLDPTTFRHRFTNPHGPEGPPSPSIIACVLAWGAKFSEHPLIVADRESCSAELTGGRKRSRLAQLMACRAQEVLETHKVFRTPSLESLQASLMMVSLAGPGNYRFWHCASVELCLALGFNKRTVVTKKLTFKERGPAGFAFWFTFWHDACASTLARQSPRMQEDDHDLDVTQFYEVNANHHPIGGLSQLQTWHTSVSSLSRICRTLARGLFLPKCERLGLPMSKLKTIADAMRTWRTEYLAKVGVPMVWPESWDFVAAVTACSSDLLYHALWVVVAQTLDTHGIYEARQIDRGDAFGSSDDFAQTRMEADALRSKVNDEALHGALRISALASVLTTNSYLRLDPNVLFASIREGGRYLAKMGRKEVGPCIAGLRQYGMSFEEAFDEVEHLEKLIAEREGAGGLHQVEESIATTTTTTTNTNAPTNPTTASQMPTQVHTQGINHHGNIQGTMSASPNSYSISSMSNPPPSDFAFALASSQQMGSEFPMPYGDSHGLFSYG
ncbi:hypothetical protein NliqN6_2950 [Naganishia liquefaciens]|uniref:Zn(2)-C6 fungal-type domain-containing protein n=1 Tax=Naganishia liquefaciens TaxID=104408 RepID=A0A8H3TSY9_9TREE|nr:hypothetical protein NliqN6_2950 [Naganishia liquefaciens]